MLVVAVILLFIILVGAWEYQLHLHNLRRVPLRVHVNGTRGKSSVTRLIAAGLRSGGQQTCAKTTGSRPRMILEDGSEYDIQRQGRANVIEQLRSISVAARRGAKCVVLECMALSPTLQEYTERKMVRSSFGVITNARADHLDVMGPTVNDVARALAGSTPRGGPLVTAETNPELLSIFRTAAERKGVELISVTPEGEKITGEIMRRFSYIEHPENVALAVKVCELAGVARKQAIEGMCTADPDIGALRVIRLAFFAKQIEFINAFAANDPDSNIVIWQRLLDLYPDDRRRVVILNCRPDRTQRSAQLGRILPECEKLDRALVTGRGTRMAIEAALKAGLPGEKIITMEDAAPDQIFERAVAQIEKAGSVFGMGNIGGGGLEIVEYFTNRAMPPGNDAAGG